MSYEIFNQIFMVDGYADGNSTLNGKPHSPGKQDPITLKPVHGRWEHDKYMNEMILFQVQEEGGIRDLHIASDVGWEMTNPNFAYHHWNKWDGEGDMKPDKKEVDLQAYDDDLKGHDADYYNGGTLWSQWGGIIATAHPYIIKPGDYDPERGFLAHRSQGHSSDPQSPFDHWVHEDSRYLIENLPQFLEQPGEYYYDDDYSNSIGRLFLRLPEDKNPNKARIELSTAWNSIFIDNQDHIEISGLTFQMNGRKGNVIEILNNASKITIKNCTFKHLANDGIIARVQANEHMENIEVTDCDFNRVNGGSAISILGHGGRGLTSENKLGILDNVKVLRNRTRNTGLYRHNDHRWSNVPSITSVYGRKMEVAGADFRPKEGSPAINNGVKYFVPWGLYGTVGEWSFNANHNNPEMILDYHHYPTKLYFHRKMYYRVPVNYDFTGNSTVNKRDAGAIERLDQ
jgi:hypothetical protein